LRNQTGSTGEPAPLTDEALGVSPADERHLQTDAPQVDRRVLIVDDDPDVAQLVADVLGEEGWSTVTTHSTHDALELLHAECYSLVIADLLMPDGGGRRLLEENRSMEQSAPVLIMSGTIDIGGQSVTSLGAAHCLSKPFTINRLIDAANHAAGLA